jgi:hypothetical protein
MQDRFQREDSPYYLTDEHMAVFKALTPCATFGMGRTNGGFPAQGSHCQNTSR